MTGITKVDKNIDKNSDDQPQYMILHPENYIDILYRIRLFLKKITQIQFKHKINSFFLV